MDKKLQSLQKELRKLNCKYNKHLEIGNKLKNEIREHEIAIDIAIEEVLKNAK